MPATSRVLVVLLLGGCPPMDNPYAPFPEPSYAEFPARIQPVLTERCANLGCHGNVDISLTLYAPGYLRATPTSRGTPVDEDTLTGGELRWNYDAMRMRLVDETSAEDSLLLRKCIDPEVGGIVHDEDVVVFPDLEDPDYLLLRDWIAGAL